MPVVDFGGEGMFGDGADEIGAGFWLLVEVFTVVGFGADETTEIVGLFEEDGVEMIGCVMGGVP